VSAPGSSATPAIAALAVADQDAASVMLARAFRDNPLNVAVIGARRPARRLRSNLHGMRSLLPVAEAYGDVLAARLAGRVVGTLISAPPGAYPLPSPAPMSRLRCVVGQGIRVASRWGRVFETLRDHHPSEPSWYLGTLGVDPEFQGRGVGSALVLEWLERVDRDRCSAYLETDLAENVRFYARVGFEVEGEIAVFGIPIWRMRRAPRALAFSAASEPH
jgi:ribosomal protein S18 acetylase RimI-like enzyme